MVWLNQFAKSRLELTKCKNKRNVVSGYSFKAQSLGWKYLKKGCIENCFIPVVSGVANTGAWGQSTPFDSEKFAQSREKERKNQEKEGKNREKSGKRGKIRKKKAKFGKVLSLCPSWHIGLAMLLPVVDDR